MMRVSICVAVTVLTLTSATPIASPQGIDFSAYDAALAQLKPNVVVPAGPGDEVIAFDPTPVISSAIAGATSGDLQKRQACSPYAAGGGPTVTSPADDADSFLDYAPFAATASIASTPDGYTAVPGFQNLQGSVSENMYMGVVSTYTSYNTSACATECDYREGCVSFNIFYERDPTVDADDSSCPDPPSTTLIKCTFWGLSVLPSDATNVGQYQSQFHVVIAGSNAYTNQPAPIAEFTGPVSLGDAIIQPPDGDTSYMGLQIFPNTPYNPQVCADACNAKSEYNIERADSDSDTPPTICNFFVAYILYKNDANGIFTCMYYAQAWDPSYATNVGQYDGDGNHYTLTLSNTYTVSS